MSYHEGLKSYHAVRHKTTHEKLWNALLRMQSGEVIHLKDGFKWTKSNWAKEAEVNINTVCKKNPDGTFVFIEANECFEQGPACTSPSVKQTRIQIANLQAAQTRLHEIIRQRDLRIGELEEQLDRLIPKTDANSSRDKTRKYHR